MVCEVWSSAHLPDHPPIALRPCSYALGLIYANHGAEVSRPREASCCLLLPAWPSIHQSEWKTHVWAAQETSLTPSPPYSLQVRPFLLEALRGAGHEVAQHGGCLGLGLAALGSGLEDEEACEDVKNVLYTDRYGRVFVLQDVLLGVPPMGVPHLCCCAPSSAVRGLCCWVWALVSNCEF